MREAVYDKNTGLVIYKDVPDVIYVPTVEQQINEYKRLLSETDYKAIKYAEGQITEDEYSPIKRQRQQWRNKINELEREI